MTTTIEIDWNAWCGSKPFEVIGVKSGWKCATDGAAIVRVPCQEPDTETRRWIESAARLFEKMKDDTGEWMPWPDASGIVCGRIDCKTCDGDGYVGAKECMTCSGHGKANGPKHIRVGSLFVAAKYDALVRSLPRPEFRIDGEYIHVRFDGGEAVIASLWAEEEAT